MKVGDPVIRTPETFYDADMKLGRSERHPMRGIVFYIHPKGRYHVVEFETRGGKIREAFLGT